MAEDPDDKGAQSGGDGGASDSGGQDKDGRTNNDAGAQGGDSTGSSDDSSSAEKSEADRLRERMRAADQRASKAEAELRQVKDKDLPALEKANRDLAEATKRIEALEAELHNQRISNAFLSDNEFEWHKPEQAMRLADLSKVDIEDDGKVTGLKDALRALAKDSPHLLKPKKSGEGDGGSDTSGGTGGTGGTGKGNATPPVNGGSGGNNAALAAAEKLRRFPALRTRGGGG